MRLPLFPLNTVLFPGMPLSLHIFENRYKTMINACVAEQMPFGVVLIEQGLGDTDPRAVPHALGCTADIAELQPLPGGRMNLVAVGKDRFRIRALDRSKAYLMADVDVLPMVHGAPDEVRALGHLLRPNVAHYLLTLAQAGDVDFDPDQLPTDAMDLANLAAYLLRVPPEEKQALLAVSDALGFVTMVRGMVRREMTLLSVLLRTDEPPVIGPFSAN